MSDGIFKDRTVTCANKSCNHRVDYSDYVSEGDRFYIVGFAVKPESDQSHAMTLNVIGCPSCYFVQLDSGCDQDC